MAIDRSETEIQNLYGATPSAPRGYIWGTLLLPFLSGCLGTTYPFGDLVRSDSPRLNVNKVSIRIFKNKTGEVDLEKKLKEALIREFTQEGRLSYTSDENEADGILIGTIRQFNETEIKQHKDVNLSEYRLAIVADLQFLDRSKNQALWEEPLLERRSTFVGDVKAKGKAADLAKSELCERFAKDIVRRTMEKLKKDVRPSPRKVEDSLPANPPPKYPSTAPF